MTRPGLTLARGKFDVGLVTTAAEASLEFWGGVVGLELIATIEPVEGVLQHRFDLHGAVLKVNAVTTIGPSPRRAGVRLLTIATTAVDEPTHLVDPDGNLLHLVPELPGGATFDAHLAVSDEAAFERWFGEVLALPRVGHRTYEVDGATMSFSWAPDVHPGLVTGPLGYSYLTIQVLDAVATHADLCARGATELEPPSGEHFATASVVSFVADPDGGRVEISQRPDLVALHEGRDA